MANIEYKTMEEQNLIIPFNPHRASMEKLEEYRAELISKYGTYRQKIWNILLLDHDFDEDSTREHFSEIYSTLWDSSPFDKKILKNYNIQAVDNVKLEDFKYEENFRDCLNVYYEWLLSIYAERYCLTINSNKLKEMIINSPVDTQILINEIFDELYPKYSHLSEKNITEMRDITGFNIVFEQIYDGNRDNYLKYGIIVFHIQGWGFAFTKVKSIIIKIEQKLC